MTRVNAGPFEVRDDPAMILRIALSAAVLTAVAVGQRPAPAAAPPIPWRQYLRAADAGYDGARIDALFDVVAATGSAAFFVVVRGHVLCAYGEVERPFECHSVRKSLVGVLVGQEIDAGRLEITATLADLGIDDEPPLSDAEKKATVADLVRSRSGVYHPAAKEPADMKAERPPRGSARPGERFWYNNWDFNVLGSIVERSAGTGLYDAFAARVAAPLGMEDHRAADQLAELEPSSSIHTAHAFTMSARDLARVGLLFANGGLVGDRRVVGAAWIEQSTRVHSPTRGESGYGQLWWSYPRGSFGPDGRLAALDRVDSFAATGTGGQLLLVVPAFDLVIVHRADTWHGPGVRGAKAWDLCERVVEARTGEPASDPQLGELSPRRLPRPVPAIALPASVPFGEADVAAVLGAWRTADGQQLRIHRHAGRLFGAVAGLGETELFHAVDGRWFSRSVPVTATVRPGAGGGADHLQVEMGGRALEFERDVPR